MSCLRARVALRSRPAVLARFNESLQSDKVEEVASLFAEECYWRDLVAFTWNIKTLEGRGEDDPLRGGDDALLHRLEILAFPKVATWPQPLEYFSLGWEIRFPPHQGRTAELLLDSRWYAVCSLTWLYLQCIERSRR